MSSICVRSALNIESDTANKKYWCDKKFDRGKWLSSTHISQSVRYNMYRLDVDCRVSFTFYKIHVYFSSSLFTSFSCAKRRRNCRKQISKWNFRHLIRHKVLSHWKIHAEHEYECNAYFIDSEDLVSIFAIGGYSVYIYIYRTHFKYFAGCASAHNFFSKRALPSSGFLVVGPKSKFKIPIQFSLKIYFYRLNACVKTHTKIRKWWKRKNLEYILARSV